MLLLDLLFNVYQQNDIIRSLLKHDAVIYGPYIRNLICNNQISETDAVVITIIPIVYKKIIERNLSKYIKKKITTCPLTNKLKEKITYIFKNTINNKPNWIQIVEVHYISEIFLDTNGNLSSNSLSDHLLLDINSIAITRSGITLIQQKKETNEIEIANPFLNILKNIDKNQFRIVNNITNLSQIKLIFNYTDNGWKQKSSLISIKKGKPKDFCAICREKADENEIMFKLPCSHSYHKDCWREHVLITCRTYFSVGGAIFDRTNKSLIIKCPECRKEYSILEVLN